MEFKTAKRRKELALICGKGAYAFFPSLLFSSLMLTLALFICAFLLSKETGLFDFLNFENSVSAMVPSIGERAQNPFFQMLIGLLSALSKLFKYLPAALLISFLFLFFICPIYEGTVRWAAFLMEEKRALPLSAIMFYFSSPKLYFKSVLLSIRLFLRKTVLLICFLLLPSVCIYVSLALTGEYYGQYKFAAASLILSLVWFALALLLFILFCQRYSAVRYLFALGSFKKIFKKSREISNDLHFEIFKFKLTLLPNFLLFIPIATAPLALSKIICSKNIFIKELILIRKIKNLPHTQ